VRDGEIVHKNQRLAIITAFAKQDNIAETIGLLNEKKKNLEDLKKGSRPEEIEQERRTITRLKVERDNLFKNDAKKNQLREQRTGRVKALEKAEAVRDSYQKLLDKELIAPVLFQQSQSDVEIAESGVKEIDAELRVLDENARNRSEELTAEIAEHESRLDLLLKGNREDVILQSEEEVKKLQDTVDRYTKELKKTEIFSEFDGVVNTPFVEQLERKHRNAGEEIMRINVTSTVQAELMVSELENEDVYQGNDVEIRFRSFPSRDFTGKIDRIAPAAKTVNGQQMIPMYVILDNPDGILKPGLTGVAKISCGKRMIIELMTRRVHRWIKTEFWKIW